MSKYSGKLTFKEHIQDISSDLLDWVRYDCRIKPSHIKRFKQWIIKKFMRDLHDAHVSLYESHGEWQHRHRLAQLRIESLRMERAELTEILLSLVAMDEDGHWTTVFHADTRLPEAYQSQLDLLVNKA